METSGQETSGQKTYQKVINDRIEEYLSDKKGLYGVLQWSLQGGKRIRSSMVLDIVKSMRSRRTCFDIDRFFVDCALCIEFLHNASLIIDDLPCMDNDSYRRGIESVHKRYGEATAHLAAMCLVSGAFASTVKGLDGAVKAGIFSREKADRLGMIMASMLSDKVGILGACGGQYMEFQGLLLRSSDKKLPGDNYKKTIHQVFQENKNMTFMRDYVDKKTGAFFEIPFVMGWLLGNGSTESEHLEQIMKLARSFGMLYQISDDFDDCLTDAEKGYAINLVNECGWRDALAMYDKEKENFIDKMTMLGLFSPYFQSLIQLMENRVSVARSLKTKVPT